MKLVFECSRGFVVDLVQDIRRVNDEAMKARKTGVIVLGCLVAETAGDASCGLAGSLPTSNVHASYP